MKMKEKGITIHDVAKRAEVSITTVSRYMNGSFDNMSEGTRQRLEQVIRELDYRPNNLARGLKSQNSRTIGCVVADMANPFSALLIKGINKVCREQGYQVLILDADNDGALEKDAYKSLLNNPVEGIIANTTGKADAELLAAAGRLPLVLADRVIESSGQIDSVVSDNWEATYHTVQYLLEKGYERIGFFSPPTEHISTRSARLDAFRQALKELRGEDTGASVFLCEGGGPQALSEKLRQFAAQVGDVPAAIFSVNGEMTRQILHEMRSQGLKLSPSLGLCSFDDWDWLALVGSGITTVATDTYEMGVKSAALLFEKMAGREKLPVRRIEMKNVLVERSSTCRVNDE